MEKITENSTERYAQSIAEDVKIEFIKTTSPMNVSVYGKILKRDAEVGCLSYDQSGNNMVLQFKPYTALSPEEKTIICQSAMPCISELID